VWGEVRWGGPGPSLRERERERDRETERERDRERDRDWVSSVDCCGCASGSPHLEDEN